MSEKLINRMSALFVFLFSLIVYLMSMAPTVSFWDCGEFIACAYKLMVPHPPGAPFFLLSGRIFSMLPLFENIGARVNFMSVLSSALTVMLLYHVIVYFSKKLIEPPYAFIDKLSIYGAGIIGSLIFAFTHSFWFNAVEAEVYALSMLFTALVVFLIVRWEEHADEPGNEKYLLMIFYMIGLAIGVHLLNVLALPFIFLMYFYRKFEVSFKNFLLFILVSGLMFVLIYPGIVFGLPELAESFGFTGLGILILIMVVGVLFYRHSHQIISFSLLAVILVLIGYSSYTMVYVRSNLNPVIDENNPETIENFISYLKREQYGEHSLSRKKAMEISRQKGRNFDSVGEFFWNYQINEMYNRYFLWQFLGMSDDEQGVDPARFLFIPFLLGFLGLSYQVSRNRKDWFSIMALFFMTGYAIILYLNQDAPQPRERDYSYVGSFFAFAIWIGIGVHSILQNVKKMQFEGKNIVAPSAWVVLFLLGPVLMLGKDFHRQSRHGNYLAWDHSYNMLQSCEKDAILITYGDNDTFPLWYLQEVENIRKDVRLVNLQLVNTDWYIYQLKHLEPKVPISMTDFEIKNIQSVVFRMPWENNLVKLNVPKEQQLEEYRRKITQTPPGDKISADTTGAIEFNVKGKFRIGPTPTLRIQDYMVLRILNDNKWRKPVYFSATTPNSDKLDGLRKYLRTDGLAERITTQKGWEIEIDKVADLFEKTFKFRGLNDPSVYMRGEHMALIGNYWSTFQKLMSALLVTGKVDRAGHLMKLMHEKIDTKIFPIPHPQTQMIDYLQGVAVGFYQPDTLDKEIKDPNFKMQILSFMAENMYSSPYVNDVLQYFLTKYESNPMYKNQIETYLKKYETKRQKLKMGQ